MKILVFAHKLQVGGSQVNAIELSSALRDYYGHDVVLFATPGPMVQMVKEKCLRFLPAPEPRRHPAPARMRALRDAVRREQPDLVQVWDWWQCLDAYYAVHVLMRVPIIVTDTLMSLTRLLPKEVPTTFGTPELVDQAKARGYRRVELIVPPVDVHLNAPEAVNPLLFRRRCGIADDDITLVTVSRLENQMKGESLFRTLDVVCKLGHKLPIRFVIVGDGTARDRLERMAHEINVELRRPAVLVMGPLLDPRPAYAAADIVVGMGGSALRGMAFGKPVVIVGEQGFSAPLTTDTAESYYYKGIYGLGDGDPGNARLLAHILSLAEHPEQRVVVGQFSREFVVRHFSLEKVSARLDEFCRNAMAEMAPPLVTAADALRTTAVYLRERRFRWRWSPAPNDTWRTNHNDGSVFSELQ